MPLSLFSNHLGFTAPPCGLTEWQMPELSAKLEPRNWLTVSLLGHTGEIVRWSHNTALLHRFLKVRNPFLSHETSPSVLSVYCSTLGHNSALCLIVQGRSRRSPARSHDPGGRTSPGSRFRKWISIRHQRRGNQNLYVSLTDCLSSFCEDSRLPH